MKISARNVLKAVVFEVKHGAVNSEVVLQTVSGEQIVAIITKDSAENLDLAPGKEVYAVIKASNVMVAVD